MTLIKSLLSWDYLVLFKMFVRKLVSFIRIYLCLKTPVLNYGSRWEMHMKFRRRLDNNNRSWLLNFELSEELQISSILNFDTLSRRLSPWFYRFQFRNILARFPLFRGIFLLGRWTPSLLLRFILFNIQYPHNIIFSENDLPGHKIVTDNYSSKIFLVSAHWFRLCLLVRLSIDFWLSSSS